MAEPIQNPIHFAARIPLHRLSDQYRKQYPPDQCGAHPLYPFEREQMATVEVTIGLPSMVEMHSDKIQAALKDVLNGNLLRMLADIDYQVNSIHEANS